jgi:hypothetical protein
MSTGKVRVCPCGHEERWHLKNASGARGACNYGHDHPMGGCSCPKFHARRWGSAKAAAPAPPADDIAQAFEKLRARVDKALGDFEKILFPHDEEILGRALAGALEQEIHRPHEPVEPPRTKRDPLPARENGEWKPGKCERALLVMLGQRRLQPTRFKQLAVMTEYRSSSGGFKNAITSLRSRGLLEGPRTALRITSAGLSVGPSTAPLPTGKALLDFWWPKLNKCERAIVTELYGASPGGYSRASLAEMTGYSETSGGYKNALSHLRTLELVQGSDVLVVTDAVRGIAPSGAGAYA